MENKVSGVASNAAVLSLVLFAFLAGCSAYRPATVRAGVIQNLTVGWNGYSVRVPDGTVLVYPALAGSASARAEEFVDWYGKQANRYGWEWYTSLSEQFLMEDAERAYMISFISDTFELPTSWSHVTPLDLRYACQEMIHRKMVVINDMKAHNEQITINGQHGWYISGESRPYFKKNPPVSAYEGIFIIGTLKEAFWIEGFGEVEHREELKVKVREMAESLEIR